MTRLTIGLPVYNGGSFLPRSLDSLLGQTYTDFFLVISDNGSTDQTEEVCRQYARQDDRIRYVRQAQNIGAAPNHNYLVDTCGTELFKWASGDDLFARDLIAGCVQILDSDPSAVLAHCYTAAIDANDLVTQAERYPLATDHRLASERFRSMLFGPAGIDPRGPAAQQDAGAIRADDWYGVIRTAVLRQVRPLGSYFNSDRTFMAELAIRGPFRQIADWLYFRRDHDDRAAHAHPTIRTRCANLDPHRANPWTNPTPRLVAEYLWGFARAIQRVPLPAGERQACYSHYRRWLAHRALPNMARAPWQHAVEHSRIRIDHPPFSVESRVAGPRSER